MADSTGKSIAEQVQTEMKVLLESASLPFEALLSVERIEAALKAAGIKSQSRIYTPQVTLWAFLSQILTKEGTCETAVAHVLVHRIENGLKACSSHTGSYSDARMALPESLISGLAIDVGSELHNQVPDAWNLH